MPENLPKPVERITTNLLAFLELIISSEKADKGNIQLYDRASGELRIVAQKGFDEAFLNHFMAVRPFDSSACGRAYGIGSTVIINDTEADAGFKSNRSAARKAGFRAVKSVPVFGKNQKCIGVISTHFKECKWSWETHGLVNILPKIAAELEALSEVV